MSESERSEAISVLQGKLNWANQNRYPYVSQREVKVYQMIINFLKGDEMNQRSMLDKIRAEIDKHKLNIDKAISEDELKIEGMKEAYADCLEVIDKYKAESEEV